MDAPLTSSQRLLILLEHPLPEIRREGDEAYDLRHDNLNPYPPNTPEAVNWDAGWADAHHRNS